MNKLIILDKDISIHELNKVIDNIEENVSIFSLISDCFIINKIKQHLEMLVKTKINIIESCTLINHEVILMQKNIHTWSYELSHCFVGKKTLKEWFLLPDKSGTSWWFSLISEKNSVQDDVFFKIAQMNAVKNHLEKNNYDTCVIAISDKKIRNTLKKMISLSVKKTIVLRANTAFKKKYRVRWFNLMNQMGLLGAICFSMLHWAIWLRDSHLARRAVPKLKERMTKSNPFLFITYFPNIDEELANIGVFHNKYAGSLQKKITELSIPVTWLIMPVFYNGHNFQSAMRLAKAFCQHGEKLFILQEFFSFKVFLKSLWWWFRQVFLSVMLLYLMDKKKLTANLTHSSCLPLLKYLWWHSFVGMSGTRGIIFYLTYCEIFKTFPHIDNCLYFCEMQAWEKALVLAKKKISPTTNTLAFQHTVVMRNFFNYFYDERETYQHGHVFDMPLPDQLLANGKLMYSLLSESKYPHLAEVEAVRQLYLHYLHQSSDIFSLKSMKKPVFLVVGSCDRTETKSMISMVYTAFPIADEFDIYFKGSPVNPIEPLFSELGITLKKTNYKILYDDIALLLKLSVATLVANTTVAIEAIAFNCELIIPIFSDTMLMNPVIETDADYLLVRHADQLKSFIEIIIHQRQNKDIKKAKEVIKNYWNIDPQLPLWTNILTSYATI